jgi:hypothetical protein
VFMLVSLRSDLFLALYDRCDLHASLSFLSSMCLLFISPIIV